MTDALRSILLGTSGLAVAALAAAGLTASRNRISRDRPRRLAVARLAALVVLVQGLHFTEELLTGFHRRFPELLGLAPWSSDFFVWFNVAWLAVWLLGAAAFAAGRRAALFPLWLLAIAGVANGIVHPALALRASGYFPGLATAPFIGIGGALLFRALSRLTAAGAD